MAKRSPSSDSGRQSDSQPSPSAVKTGGNREAQFDLWLEDKLRTAYGSVLDEPIPEDLIRLLHHKLKD